MLGRASARCHDILQEGLSAGPRPHRPCVPAAVRAALGGGSRGSSGRRNPGSPARDPCLRSRGQEGGCGAVLKKPSSDSPSPEPWGERLAPQSPETRGNGTPGGSGEGVRLSLGPERPPVTNLRSATVPRSLRPGEGTRRFGAAERRALQIAASERASQSRLLGSPGPPGRALSAPVRSPPESLCPSGSQRPAPRGPPLWVRSLLLQTALSPHLGAAWQSPAARDLSAAAATELSGAPPPPPGPSQPPHVGRLGQQTWR